MTKTLLTLIVAALAGALTGSVAFVLSSAASGNSFGWLGALGLGLLIGVWPALAITFCVGAPTVALLRKMTAPLIAYPICGLILTAALARAGHSYFNSASGERLLGTVLIGAQQFWLPSALAGGIAVTAVISFVESIRARRA